MVKKLYTKKQRYSYRCFFVPNDRFSLAQTYKLPYALLIIMEQFATQTFAVIDTDKTERK